jgi:hypothetical protein
MYSVPSQYYFDIIALFRAFIDFQFPSKVIALTSKRLGKPKSYLRLCSILDSSSRNMQSLKECRLVDEYP